MKQRELMVSKAEALTVILASHELVVSPEQVARYAGGTRYRMDASQRQHVGIILDRAYELAEPAFVYRVHEVAEGLEGGHARLKKGDFFPVPADEQDSGLKFLVFCVCTIGGRLEEAVRALMAAGDTLGSLFLDAAGVAFLEALSTRAYETLQEQAQTHHLQAGCRFGPGYGGLELSNQKQLFELVEASRIGVRLNESFVMSPAKSLSFVTPWTSSHKSLGRPYKCASCALPHCPFRL
jgi:hypothetical protein